MSKFTIPELLLTNNLLMETGNYFSIGHSTRLLNLAADGECTCDGKEISAFFDSVVVVAETEMEVCCDMRADFVTDAQRRLVTFRTFLAIRAEIFSANRPRECVR